MRAGGRPGVVGHAEASTRRRVRVHEHAVGVGQSHPVVDAIGELDEVLGRERVGAASQRVAQVVVTGPQFVARHVVGYCFSRKTVRFMPLRSLRCGYAWIGPALG